MSQKLKLWITNNFDGYREALVIASSKDRARKIAGVGRTDFEGYWRQGDRIDATLEPEVLYTRMRQDHGDPLPWQKGHCPRNSTEKKS